MSVDLIIGGASKAGTTALYDMLKQSPAFFLPERKELHYFSRPDLEKTTAGPGDAAVLAEIPATLKSYLHHYEAKQPGQVAVDISPSYLFHYGSAARIAEALPSARAVFILREPEEKVFSQYVHLVGEARESLSFENALEAEPSRKSAGYADMWLYRESGYYADAIAAFQRALGAENVKVILFDDFRRDPQGVLKAISLFAGVTEDQRFDTSINANVSGAPRSRLLARIAAPNRFTNILRALLPPPVGQALRRALRKVNTGAKPELPDQVRAALRSDFRGDIDRLEALIGRPTGWLENEPVGIPAVTRRTSDIQQTGGPA
ncbi:sulfotransferase [Erythrobacteraceae bacterium WH01K]|nr:sulfotransferase [Erythrobacteraceae bacterium WH01K]